MKIKELNPRITCADGVSLSVQANRYAYCTPRIDYLEAWTDYIDVEVGFIKDQFGEPFTPPAEWNQYGDGCNPCDVYAYIPTRMVKSFIASHGGEKTPKNWPMSTKEPIHGPIDQPLMPIAPNASGGPWVWGINAQGDTVWV